MAESDVGRQPTHLLLKQLFEYFNYVSNAYSMETGSFPSFRPSVHQQPWTHPFSNINNIARIPVSTPPYALLLMVVVLVGRREISFCQLLHILVTFDLIRRRDKEGEREWTVEQSRGSWPFNQHNIPQK